MSFYFKLFVFILIGALISLFIFLTLSSVSFEGYTDADYPVGSFDVHMFFERQQNYL